MKVLPYLRFTWAALIIFNFVSWILAIDNFLFEEEIFVGIVAGLPAMIFVIYCTITGLQELRSMQLIEARFFNAFGVFTEVLIFLVGYIFLQYLWERKRVHGGLYIYRFGNLVANNNTY